MTDAVTECVKRIKARLEYTCTPYESEDILVIEEDGVTFVLANPVLGEEAVYGDYEEPTQYVPMRNITLVYLDIGMREISKDFTLKIPMPWVRVLRPDLCMKIIGSEICDASTGELQCIAEAREVDNAKLAIKMMETTDG